MAARGRAGALARLGGLAAVTIAVAGCGSGVTAEQWTDQMCGAVLPFVRTATTPPTQGADPVATTREVRAYLDRTTTALDGTLDTLERLGPAPVDDGAGVSGGLRDSLTGVRTAFASAKARVDALDTSDPATLTPKLREAVAPISRLGDASAPVAGLTSKPELSAAAQVSANCRSLNEVSQAARRSSAGPPAPNPEGDGN